MGKIEWAGVHLKTLEDLVREFRQDHPYEIISEHEASTGDDLRRVKFLRAPRDEISLALGDVIGNLRSSLDHLVCELTGGPCEETFFPIYWRKDGTYESFHGKGRKGIAFLGPEVEHAIEALQPYNAGHEPLGLLNDLWNIDKHRRLLVTGSLVAPTAIFVPMTPQAGGGFAGHGPSFSGVVYNDGDEIARYKGGFRPGIDHEPKFACDVTINEVGAHMQVPEPALGFAIELRDMVRDEVFPTVLSVCPQPPAHTTLDTHFGIASSS
jgi:hypothetical protein